MNFLKQNFDDFNIHARIIPALIIALPIYFYLMITEIIELGFMDMLKNSLFFVLLIAIYYRIIRDLGKSYEDKMYKKLGNKPTTIILRYSDDNIDEITKTRYHKKLNKNISNLRLPVKKEEELLESDIAYESAINWLRNYANTHRENEQRTYQELKEYNFYRNLYGGKWIIIISCIICMIMELIKFGSVNVIQLLQVKVYAIRFLIMLGILLISCIVINKNTVEKKAFDYAKTLIEICERL